MNCNQCGTQFEGKFCPNCGAPARAETPAVEQAPVMPVASVKAKKPIYKKWWFWTVVGVVLASLVLGTFLLVNRDTKPRLDKDGNPVFIELTNEVYTNAEKYKGYHINIKGKVFQVMGDNGTSKGIQVWLDPETCEQNLMIYYKTHSII